MSEKKMEKKKVVSSYLEEEESEKVVRADPDLAVLSQVTNLISATTARLTESVFFLRHYTGAGHPLKPHARELFETLQQAMNQIADLQ